MSYENGIPRSVDEAAELAEELHARMYPQQLEEPEEDTQPEQEEYKEVVDEDEEEDEAPAPDDVKELKKYRDRYLSLKGKYDAEVPRLAAELRELREKITAPPQKQVEAPVEEEEDYISTVSEEYGEDFINAIRKVIQHEVKPIVKPVMEQAQAVQETQTEAATESFKAYLDQKVEKGNWRDLWDGKDPGFIEFLKEPDPSGLYTWGDLTQMYNERWDADKLAKVFDTYLETKQEAPPRNEKRNVPNHQKDALIAPSRTNTQTAPNSDGKRIWTMESFQEFQRLDRMGKYSPEESARLWDDAASAPSEGRMR